MGVGEEFVGEGRTGLELDLVLVLDSDGVTFGIGTDTDMGIWL